MKTTFIERLKSVFTQYQTRQQLLNLPEHLLKDIAITSEQLAMETKKNALFIILRRLIKGH